MAFLEGALEEYLDDKLVRIDPWLAKSVAKYDNATKDNNECVLVALHVLTKKMMPLLAQYAASVGRTTRRGMWNDEIVDLMKLVGGTFTPIYEFELNKNIQSKVKITLGEFIKRNPTGKFFVTERGHAFAIVDGVIYDWDKITPKRLNAGLLAVYQYEN